MVTANAAGRSAPEAGSGWHVRPDVREDPMRKLITALIASALLSAGAVTGVAGTAHAGRAHTVTYQAAGGDCSNCWTLG
jgi:hypothetical protein